jgi:hypothetical protein
MRHSLIRPVLIGAAALVLGLAGASQTVGADER